MKQGGAGAFACRNLIWLQRVRQVVHAALTASPRVATRHAESVRHERSRSCPTWEARHEA
jgi:hypothetical protein